MSKVDSNSSNENRRPLRDGEGEGLPFDREGVMVNEGKPASELLPSDHAQKMIYDPAYRAQFLREKKQEMSEFGKLEWETENFNSIFEKRTKTVRHGSGNSDCDFSNEWNEETRFTQRFDYEAVDDRVRGEDGSLSPLDISTRKVVAHFFKGDNSANLTDNEKIEGKRAKIFRWGRPTGLSPKELQNKRQNYHGGKIPGEREFEPGLLILTGLGDGDEAVKLPLFMLPELIEDLAKRPNDPVVLCEGESDVLAARERGFIATTAPNGSGKYEARFNEAFAGREVIIPVDNDEAGRFHTATIIAEGLGRTASKATAIELPELEDSGDLEDWLDGHHGESYDELLKRLRMMVKNTRELGVFTKGVAAPQWSTKLYWEAAQSNAFERTKPAKGEPKIIKSFRNAEIAFHLMGVSLSMDKFSGRMFYDHRESGKAHPGGPQAITDTVSKLLRRNMEDRFGWKLPKPDHDDFIETECQKNEFHAVLDLLEGLGEWDGKPRLETTIIDGFGIEDTPLTRAFTRKTFIASIRRLREPGCKFDTMIVLEGAQGTKKSTFVERIALQDSWYNGDLAEVMDADAKKMIEEMSGRWHGENQEMAGGRGPKKTNRTKAKLSTRSDSSRLAYGKFRMEIPRQWIAWGTTNDDDYLNDQTGNRRTWPIKVGTNGLNEEWLMESLPQIYLEAMHYEAEGESLILPRELWGEAAKLQGQRVYVHMWQEKLSEALDGLEDCKVLKSDVYRLLGFADPSRAVSNEVTSKALDAMRGLGWKNIGQVRIGDGKRAYCFAKLTGDHPLKELPLKSLNRPEERF